MANRRSIRMSIRSAWAALVSLMFLAPALLGVGCSSAQPKTSDYVLVYLKTGPQAGDKTQAERDAIQAAHLENIKRLGNDRSLVLAGPFGEVNHDPSTRGIFVFDVPTIGEARRLTDTDPAVKAGVLVMELHTMATATDLRRALAEYLALEEQARLEGRTRTMQERIRAYVLLRVDDADRANETLARLGQRGELVLVARVDGRQGWYLLDATDIASAAKLLEGDEARLGTFTLDEWWGSAQLAEMPRATVGA
ncbi:MAG: YciI family protein [Phycisphaerales bacterium]